jgi:transcriptional regulator NrdR family protein
MALSKVAVREAAPSISNNIEDMTASTSRRKCTECEARLSTTPSSSAASYEEISPIPAMERSSSHRKSKNRPVLRGSRVNNTSQKAAE